MPANIFCCVCGARPYPPPRVREDFDLMKLDANGRPAGEGDASIGTAHNTTGGAGRAAPAA
jgi:hypothetical protein